MELISPQIVAKASELPAIVLVLAAAIGPVFWVLGWRLHRALFVAAATFVGGVYGLVHGPSLGLYPILAAGLLSLSAGGLALAILRIGVFVVCGAAVDLAATAIIADHLDDTARVWLHFVAFLVGGLLSLVWYRFLVIVLTSFAGAFLLLIGGLAFAARQGDMDTIILVEERPSLVSVAFLLLGVLGAAGQYSLDHRRAREKRSRDPTSDLLRKLLKPKTAN